MTNQDSTYVFFLQDVIGILYERGKTAQADFMKTRDTIRERDMGFADGLVMGYYECLDRLFKEADAFNIPIREICPQVDPDELIKGLARGIN